MEVSVELAQILASVSLSNEAVTSGCLFMRMRTKKDFFPFLRNLSLICAINPISVKVKYLHLSSEDTLPIVGINSNN